MSQDWMIELLTDIRNVAHKNALVQLAEHLDDAVILAAHELRMSKAQTEITSVHVRPDRAHSGKPVGCDKR